MTTDPLTLEALAVQEPSPQTGSTALPEARARALMAPLPHWTYFGRHIERTFRFANYYQTMAFVNMIAAIAHATDHHPEMSVHYGHVTVRYNTHDADQGAGGVTMNDLICAARIDLALKLSA